MITKDMAEFLFLVGVAYIFVYYALMLIVPTIKSYLNFVLDKEVEKHEDQGFTLHSIRNVLKMSGVTYLKRDYGDRYDFKTLLLLNNKMFIDSFDILMICIFMPLPAFAIYCLSLLVLTTQIGSMILISVGGFLGLSFMVRYSIVSAKQQMRKHVEKYHQK